MTDSNYWHDAHARLSVQFSASEARIERLTRALEFYADPQTHAGKWETQADGRVCGVVPILDDDNGGDMARAVLAGSAQPEAHPDTARLDKLPQCFHMLRYRNGLWHLTYETGKQYTNIREAIDAHHIWDAGALGAECAAANQVFGPGGTFGGSTDGGAP